MSAATDNKSFGSGLTSINEVRKRIDYIADDIFIFFYWYMYHILYGLHNFHIQENFHILDFHMNFYTF